MDEMLAWLLLALCLPAGTCSGAPFGSVDSEYAYILAYSFDYLGKGTIIADPRRPPAASLASAGWRPGLRGTTLVVFDRSDPQADPILGPIRSIHRLLRRVGPPC